MACDTHDIQPTSPNDAISNFEETFADLLQAAETPVEIQEQLKRWCSMCFSPASFTCCTRQASLFSTDDEEIEIDGCGLKLCTGCEIKLRVNFEGDSSLMASTLDHEGKATGDDEYSDEVMVVRADVGFLSKEGLLMKSLEHLELEGDSEGVELGL